MATRFNVRNVAQKEVYDSYMGILRISPVSVNGKDMDDITSVLNTLVDINGEIDKEGDDTPTTDKLVYVRLSDSDGNGLPIKFYPKAFTQSVRIRNSGADKYEARDIVNVVTSVDNDIYVSKNFIARSTIKLDFLDEDFKRNKYSLLTIGTDGAPNSIQGRINVKQILLYPIESPNDEFYFNNKNELLTQVAWDNSTDDPTKYHLFNPNDTSLSRDEQVRQNLLKQSKAWFDNNFPIDANDNSPHRVKVDGRFINTFNNKGEEIPVLQSHDYVLGHYDGHSFSQNASNADMMKDIWMNPSNKLQQVRDYNYITKLSWIRFDNLIWDSLNEILSGNVRHTFGRYDNLGNSKTQEVSIKKALFGEGNNGSISQSSIKYGFLDETGPLLGAGVQPGLITYHAMPFHRYWFHRCRQVAQNLKRRWVLSKSEDTEKWENPNDDPKLQDEASELCNYYKNKLITPCTMATITPTHSLAKDYLLCNGSKVSFDNFPNINPTNENLFKTKNGMPVEIDNNTKLYKFRTDHTDVTPSADVPVNYNYDNVYKALQNTKIESFDDENYTSAIYLPNLFSLTERYPRFIRGLDWQIDGENPKENNISPNLTVTNILSDYNGEKINSTNYENLLYFTSEKWLQKNEKDEVIGFQDPPKDVFEKNGAAINKNFTEVKLHFYNYDHLTETSYHKHTLFSTNEGTRGEDMIKDYTYYYDYDANNGGISHTRWADMNSINRNFLFNDVKYPQQIKSPNANIVPQSTLDYANWAANQRSVFFDLRRRVFNIIAKTPSTNMNTFIVAKSKEFLDYCFKENYPQMFYNFTPIPYVGLYLFNGDLYNNIIINYVLTCNDKTITGDTPKQLYFNLHEQLGAEKMNQIDGTGNFRWFIFVKQPTTEKAINYILSFSQYLNEKGFKFSKSKRSQVMSGDTIGTVSELENENWKGYVYYDMDNTVHRFEAANIHDENDTYENYKQITSNEQKYKFLKKHNEAKMRRKNLMMKLNESQARIPISSVGKAQFAASYLYTYERKRSWLSSTFGGDKWDTETEHFRIDDVGGYKISSFSDKQGFTGEWRCLTSLAYTNAENLARGTIAREYDPEIPDTYWNTHNVMDFYKSSQHVDKSSSTTYGDIKLKLDVDSPFPSHIKLLPLIRL